MPGLRSLGFVLLAVVLAAAAAAAQLRDGAAPEVQRVVVLANTLFPGSRELAAHYCQRRGIPEANIIALPMPVSESLSWPQFTKEVWEPLAQALEDAGWVDWLASNRRDEAGRRVRITHRHFISYLVVCRGVPLLITDAGLLGGRTVDLPLARHPSLQVTRAAVDSELAALLLTQAPTTAFIPNPLFQNEAPSSYDRAGVLRVARLEGATQEQALALVDGALKAEQDGLPRRALVDRGGPYAEGDQWFLRAATLLRSGGFAVEEDTSPATFGTEFPAGAPGLYLGWYHPDLNGPFAEPGFRFPSGAIAYHLHSFSASTLRSPGRGWAGPLVACGAAASFGNVHEPYLALTLRPDLLTKALLRGASLGEAAWYATPALSWQGVILGDPLYTPFPKAK